MKKLAISLALVLVAAACGGGDDGTDGGTTATEGTQSTQGTEATTATTAAPTTQATTGNTPIFSGDFCDDTNNETVVEGIDVFGTDIEESVNEWLAVLDAVEDAAPAEIADDVAVIADAARTFAEVLAEADYQFLNIDEDDPRLAAFDDERVEEASNNIAEYCGWDPDEFDNGGGDVGTGGAGGDDIPDGVPAELIPASFTMVQDNGIAGLNIFTDVSYDDLVAQYTELVGEPTDDTGGQAIFEGSYDGNNVFISVTDADNVRIVTILLI